MPGLVSTLDPPEGAWLFGTMAPGWHITTRPGVDPVRAELLEPAAGSSSNPSRSCFRGRATPGSASSWAAGISKACRATSPSSSGVTAARQSSRSRPAASPLFILGRRRPPSLLEAEAGDVKNLLRVEAEASVVTFLVNGQKVAEVPRDGTRFDGTRRTARRRETSTCTSQTSI